MSNVVRYLRGYMACNLNLKEHISQKIYKGMTNFTRIRPVRRFISVDACMALVIMLCIFHLDYGNSLLYGLPKKTVGRYQLMQKICDKLTLWESKYVRSTEPLCRLHWLPIQQSIEFKILVLSYKCIGGDAPRYLQDLISIRKPKRHHLHSNMNGTLLERPQVKCQTFAARSSSYSAPIP